MLGNLFGPKKDAAQPPEPMAPGAAMPPGQAAGAYPPQDAQVAPPPISPQQGTFQGPPPLTGMQQEAPAGNPAMQAPMQNPMPAQTPPVSQGPAQAAPAPTPGGGAALGGSKMDPALRQNLSALSHLDTRTTQILQNAHKEAVRTKQQHIEP